LNDDKLNLYIIASGGILLNTKHEMIYDEMSEKILMTAKDIATEYGGSAVTVRKILKELGITNRVFYNRFHNVNEVLEILYKETVVKIRESLSAAIDERKDFFDHVTDIVANTLSISYDHKKRFNNYIFQNDSVSSSNYSWWINEIIRLIEYAKAKKLIKDVDSKGLSYAIWCFCRGYNADAVSRNIPKEDAIRNFKYCFGLLLDGLKNQNCIMA
jgi:AcrR family transcriptional regulator